MSVLKWFLVGLSVVVFTACGGGGSGGDGEPAAGGDPTLILRQTPHQ